MKKSSLFALPFRYVAAIIFLAFSLIHCGETSSQTKAILVKQGDGVNPLLFFVKDNQAYRSRCPLPANGDFFSYKPRPDQCGKAANLEEVGPLACGKENSFCGALTGKLEEQKENRLKRIQEIEGEISEYDELISLNQKEIVALEQENNSSDSIVTAKIKQLNEINDQYEDAKEKLTSKGLVVQRDELTRIEEDLTNAYAVVGKCCGERKGLLDNPILIYDYPPQLNPKDTKSPSSLEKFTREMIRVFYKQTTNDPGGGWIAPNTGNEWYTFNADNQKLDYQQALQFCTEKGLSLPAAGLITEGEIALLYSSYANGMTNFNTPPPSDFFYGSTKMYKTFENSSEREWIGTVRYHYYFDHQEKRFLGNFWTPRAAGPREDIFCFKAK